MKKATTKTFWSAAGISLGLHAMLFVAWLNNPDFIQSEKIVHNHHNIDIRLIAENDSQKTSITNSKPEEPVKKTASQVPSRQLAKEPRQKPGTTVNTSKTSISAARSDKKDSDELYKLLYSAINQQKYYPVAALRLRQQGKVRVSFNLFNNGNLDNIVIARSSGYHSLDSAALLAVKRIQPFRPAAEYIASVQDFELDIIFRL